MAGDQGLPWGPGSSSFLAHLAMPKMSLYDHHLLLSVLLSVSLSVLLLGLLASVSANSSPIHFQNGCHLYDMIVSI